MSADHSTSARTRVYLFWKKDRSTGCREVLFSGEEATTSLVWDPSMQHFSTTYVLATGWHSGMLIGDDFDVVEVDPFQVPPSSSSSSSTPRIQITTPHPAPASAGERHQQSPPSSPANQPTQFRFSPVLDTSESHTYARLEDCRAVCNGDTRRHLSESDNYYDHLIEDEDSIYKVPPNNQLVDDSIYRVPPNNQLREDLRVAPGDTPDTDTSQLPPHIPRSQSSDHSNTGMRGKTERCENGSSSDGEECYQIPITHISRPKLSCNSSVRIPIHYDTQDRPLLLSRRVHSPSTQLSCSTSHDTSPLYSSSLPMISPTLQRANMLKRAPIVYKRGPPPSPSCLVRSPTSKQSPSPLLSPASVLSDEREEEPVAMDTQPTQRNAPEELQVLREQLAQLRDQVDQLTAELERCASREQLGRQELHRELLRCKTEGENWRSSYEDSNQKLSAALSQLEKERSSVSKLTQELLDLKAPTNSLEPVAEVSKPPLPRGKGPQITRPKPVIPKPAKRGEK